VWKCTLAAAAAKKEKKNENCYAFLDEGDWCHGTHSWVVGKRQQQQQRKKMEVDVE